MTWGSSKLHFTYDSLGPASVTYNGTTYLYVKNAQGDVVQIVDGNGNMVVTYIYDAWGNIPFPSKPRFYCVTNPTKGVMKLWQFSAWKRTKVIRL